MRGKNMANILEDYKNIEESFFALDHENKTVSIPLVFEKPSDIFDINAITKTPVFNDDFLEWIFASFQYSPRRYKVDLDISFQDLEGYKEEDLKKIFYKNIFLEAKKNQKESTFKNKIAIGLVIMGVLSLTAMILLMSLWKDGGIVKEIISYIFDIAVTVTLWEAMTILIVDKKEKRELRTNLLKRFHSISFHKKA